MCRRARDVDRLDSLKPHSTVNDVSGEIDILSGAVGLQSTRYKTRIRQSTNQASPSPILLVLLDGF